MAAPTRVGFTTASNSASTTSISTTVHASTVPGDLIIVETIAERGTLLPTLGGTLTGLQVERNELGSNLGVVLAWKFADVGDAGKTVTSDVTTSRRLALSVAVFRGAGTPAFVHTPYDSGSAGTLQGSAYTPTDNDSLAIGAFGFNATGTPFTRTFTPSTGYTAWFTVNATSTSANPHIFWDYKQLTGQAGVAQAAPTATMNSTATGDDVVSIIIIPPGSLSASGTAALSGSGQLSQTAVPKPTGAAGLSGAGTLSVSNDFPGEQILFDDFTGASNAAWDSTKWNVLAAEAGSPTVSLVNNRGRMAATNGVSAEIYAESKTPKAKDQELRFTFNAHRQAGSVNDNLLVAVLNGDSSLGLFATYTMNGYIMEASLGATTMAVNIYKATPAPDRVSAGSIASLAYTPDTDYKVRFQRWGGNVKFKIWAASVAEPAAWNLTFADDPAVVKGYVHLGWRDSSNTATEWIDFDDARVLRLEPSGGTFTSTGDGTLTATGKPGFLATAALSGQGNLVGGGLPGARGSAALSGSGTTTTVGSPTIPGASGATGVGTLAASGKPGFTGAMSVTSEGTLTASGVATGAGTANLGGSGTLTASGAVARITGAVAALSGQGNLTAPVQTPKPKGTAAFSGSGTLTKSNERQGFFGSANYSGSGTCSLAARPAFIVPAAFSGAGDLGAVGKVPNLSFLKMRHGGSNVIVMQAFVNEGGAEKMVAPAGIYDSPIFVKSHIDGRWV